MKTKTYLILSVVAIFSMTSCTNSTNNNSTDSKNSGAATEAQPLLNNKQAPQEFKHVIPLDAIQVMVDTYEKERVATQHQRKPNGESFIDSKNGWVSLDELSNFIEEVKAAARNKGLSTKDLGIRTYYTVYPQQQQGESFYFRSLESEYRSRQTFLMLPTYHDAKTNMERDVLSKSSDNRSLEIFSGNTADSGTTAPTQSIALNHMALCPPACPN